LKLTVKQIHFLLCDFYLLQNRNKAIHLHQRQLIGHCSRIAITSYLGGPRFKSRPEIWVF